MFEKILQEPLLHFLLVGGLLFFYLSNQDDSVAKEQLVITEGKINQLTAQFTKTRQRAPTKDELQALIDSQIREDLAFEYGSQMGLVENDTIIKRRVQQKIEFMLNDSIASLEPTKEELKAYMLVHKERYTIAPVYSFKHIYINPEKHEDVALFIKNLKAEDLSALYTERGDALMLESEYKNISTARIAKLFGLKFAKTLDTLAENEWVGAVKSGYGQHLVFIEEKKPRHLATLKELEAKVKFDFRLDAQKQAIDGFYNELKDRYEIVVGKEVL